MNQDEVAAMFRRACLPTTMELCKFCEALEDATRHLEIPDGVGPDVVVAGSLLLLLLGMVTDPDGGRENLLRAATLLGTEHPLNRDEVRGVMTEILGRMDIVFTNHLYN